MEIINLYPQGFGSNCYLVKDGKLVWCVDPNTLEIDPDIINAEINRGTTFINGVYVMSEDILGIYITKNK